MKEMLQIYSLEGEEVGIIEKKESHKRMREEYLKDGVSSIRHKHVRLLLLNSNGRIILQRRSKWKGDNAGLWDKTIGGHVSAEDNYDLTMLKECAEELGIPATVVNKEVFEHTLQTTDLNILGVLTKLCFLDNCQSVRIMQGGKKWVEPSRTQFYIGYYDGAIRFMDSESCGLQVFSKEELLKEIEESSDHFTDDISYILKKWGDRIKPAPEKITHVLND